MKHLWVIDDLSSTSLFYRNYTEDKIDPDLVSGLLSALHNFSEVELHQHGIESIMMGGLTWVYVESKEVHLLFIAADEKGVSPNVMKSRLEVIRNMFISEFEIDENWNKKFRGDVTPFLNFNDTTDLLVSQWFQAEKINSTADLFDMLGVFQQVFNLFINIIKLNFFGDNLKDINNFVKSALHELLSQKDLKSEPELQKIHYSFEDGWNIININPMQVNSQELLERALLRISDLMKLILVKKLGKMLTISSFQKELFPFLINNWKLMKKLNIDKKLMTIFLINQ
jgi:hypothetical protein